MGIFVATKKNDDSPSVLVIAQEDSLAVKYVKEIMGHAIAQSIKTVEINNSNGHAKCQYSNILVPYLNVRNRIAVMSSGVDLYRNQNDQSGIIAVMMHGKRVDINVYIKIHEKSMRLEFNELSKSKNETEE